jgi:hypothetical protein
LLRRPRCRSALEATGVQRIKANHDRVRGQSASAPCAYQLALTVATTAMSISKEKQVMKMLMSALVALSVVAALSASANATIGKSSQTLQERLKNCFPASECQPS